MNLLWIRILNFLLLTNQLTHKKIAKAIRQAIVNNILPLGTVLPTRKDVAIYLKIPKAEVNAAWKRLELSYHLIHNTRGVFWIVSVMPVNRGRNEPAEVVPVQQSYRRRIFLNQVTYNDSAEEIKSVRNLLKKAFDFMEFREGSNGEYGLDAELVAEMRTIVNGAIYSRYSQDELLYSQDAKLLMYQICAALVSPKAIAVIIGPAPVWVMHAFLETGRKVELIGADQIGLPISELEMVLKRCTVGMLYMSSRSPAPSLYALNLKGIEELSALTRTYKFVILEHDRYAGSLSGNENQLVKVFLEQKNILLYVRTLSSINSELNKINILTGPAKIILLIKKKMLNSSTPLSPVMVSKIIQMVRRNVIYQAETRVAEVTANMNAVAKEVLLESGLWNPDGIVAREGWFFHLEPVYGELPEYAYEKLAEDRIYIFNYWKYTGILNGKNGIMISIADYYDEKRLRQDLEYLTARLSRMLIMPDIKAVIN
jgi:DNA-binding transcriptional MocR family regulator